MINKLDEQMKQMMEQASLQDVLPDFDKDSLWQDIAPHLQQKKAEKFALSLSRWWTHAAAVVFAIIVTYAVTNRSEPTQHSTFTAALSGVSPQLIIKPKVAIISPERQIVPEGLKAKETKTTTIVPARTGIARAPKESSNGLPVMEEIQVQNIEPKVATAPEQASIAGSRKKRVKHYLDLAQPVSSEPENQNIAQNQFIRLKLNTPGVQEKQLQPKFFGDVILAMSQP